MGILKRGGVWIRIGPHTPTIPRPLLNLYRALSLMPKVKGWCEGRHSTARHTQLVGVLSGRSIQPRCLFSSRLRAIYSAECRRIKRVVTWGTENGGDTSYRSQMILSVLPDKSGIFVYYADTLARIIIPKLVAENEGFLGKASIERWFVVGEVRISMS